MPQYARDFTSYIFTVNSLFDSMNSNFSFFLYRFVFVSSESNHQYWVSSMGEKHRIFRQFSWSKGEGEKLNDTFHASWQSEKKILDLFDFFVFFFVSFLGFGTFRTDDWCSDQISKREERSLCWMSNTQKIHISRITNFSWRWKINFLLPPRGFFPSNLYLAFEISEGFYYNDGKKMWKKNLIIEREIFDMYFWLIVRGMKVYNGGCYQHSHALLIRK